MLMLSILLPFFACQMAGDFLNIGTMNAVTVDDDLQENQNETGKKRENPGGATGGERKKQKVASSSGKAKGKSKASGKAKSSQGSKKAKGKGRKG